MKTIAIVGSGISGLTAAYLLKNKYKVSVFEKNNYIGGHTATVDVEVNNRTIAIDTGFIVFNDRTYPLFNKLLEQIGVNRQETEMSFSVSNQLSGLEYNGHNLDTLFAQRKNLFSVRFWRLISSIIRFNKLCKKHFQSKQIAEISLGEFLKQNNFSDYFAEHYILPMGAAIWSSSIEQMEEFPLPFFIQFFFNHGLLNIADRPQWYVIPGGSRSYIAPLTKGIEQQIFLNTNIDKIQRHANGVTLFFDDNTQQEFDELILACHSDQALKLLDDASLLEKSILSDISYTANDVVLHTDTQMLPKAKKAWASWNYQLDNNRTRPASVTYNMNILMGLKEPETFCVTLNQSSNIDPKQILASFVYHHPVFNQTSFAAQQRRQQICGHQHTHFAGAYWYNGFHEDGVRSAVDVAKRLGVEL